MSREHELDEVQAILNDSWEAGRQANDNPTFRALLEDSVYQVRDLPLATQDQMLDAQRDPQFQAWVDEQVARLRAPST